MKAIILVAGAGTRLQPHTYTQPKALLPIAGKNILSHIVEQLHKEGGITEFIFVIGYLGVKIYQYVKQAYPHLHCDYVPQTDPLGTAHAVSLTKPLVGNDEVFVVLGDTIAEYDVKDVLKSPHSMLGVKQVTNPQDFGVAQIGQDGFIQHVDEMPDMPMTNMALVGLYKIKETALLFKTIHEQLEGKIQNKKKGDYNLTDALDHMIVKHGVHFKAFTVRNWIDCGRKESLLQSNAVLLRNNADNYKTDRFPGSIILPPVSIAEGCTITNSIIGPNVTIGSKSIIRQARIHDSIIGSDTTITDVVLRDSLIGSDASVKGMSTSLNIGDNTQIEF